MTPTSNKSNEALRIDDVMSDVIARPGRLSRGFWCGLLLYGEAFEVISKRKSVSCFWSLVEWGSSSRTCMGGSMDVSTPLLLPDSYLSSSSSGYPQGPRAKGQVIHIDKPKRCEGRTPPKFRLIGDSRRGI